MLNQVCEMAEELTFFKYQALSSRNSIRILILEPSSGEDTIRCFLKELPLAEAQGQYESLSYVWGIGDYTVKIICDNKEFRIGSNLNEALRRFRLTNSSRSIWADAVCINQQDRSEKGFQVRKIGEIFHKAKRVLCWLGHDTEEIANDCFDLIQKAYQISQEQWPDGWVLENLIYDLKLPGLFTCPKEQQILRHLFDLPWFERFWVVQESGLARECWIFWGDAQIQIHEIHQVAAWFAYSIHAPPFADGIRVGRLFTDVFADIMCTFHAQSTWRENYTATKRMKDFYPVEKQLYVDLLFCARSLKVTDQRDVIYASLGSPLACYENGEVMVPPDYDESLSALQLRAAKALIQKSREAPHVLLRVIHNADESTDTDSIPTWVPRWTTFNDASSHPIPLTLTYEYRRLPYRASYGSPPFSPSFQSNNILSVTGLMFDTLAWTSLPFKADDFRSDIDHWDPQFRNSKLSAIETIWLQLLLRPTGSSEELITSFSLTLARGRPKSKDYLNDFLAYCENLRRVAGSKTSSPWPSHNQSKGIASDAEWVIIRAMGRRLACTSHGRLALVPIVATIGDSICIVQGMDVPVVLRQTQQGAYKFAGESYVHGVMEGELVAPENAIMSRGWELIHLQ